MERIQSPMVEPAMIATTWPPPHNRPQLVISRYPGITPTNKINYLTEASTDFYILISQITHLVRV